MGPQPPLKRRPTYTPYTRPYQTRRIRETDLRRCKKPSYHPPCGSIYIYIYMHACMYTHVDTVATNRYLTVTSLDIFRPLPTHFHPVCPAHRNSPLFSPDIFRFQLFHRFVTRLLDPRVLHFRSPTFAAV